MCSSLGAVSYDQKDSIVLVTGLVLQAGWSRIWVLLWGLYFKCRKPFSRSLRYVSYSVELEWCGCNRLDVDSKSSGDLRIKTVWEEVDVMVSWFLIRYGGNVTITKFHSEVHEINLLGEILKSQLMEGWKLLKSWWNYIFIVWTQERMYREACCKIPDLLHRQNPMAAYSLGCILVWVLHISHLHTGQHQAIKVGVIYGDI